ncbi:DUF3291 domain-containing protein [Hoeflea olei]|uniref:DUF3291 domain-containing protein n=1 Tax=Hoeflea olei TaxID=1480615 RepID=A0A1C1YXR9_9HYPH|nr:DUF3291 domain-containing protein [Hoeflea olei]OCW58311.1 hypothetical protein AWJ14_21740 [Hoeflea olei]
MPSGARHLAMYNFGLHVADYNAPEVRGFLLREPLNFQAAERAAGFVGRSGYAGESGPESWGVQVFPRFIEGSGRESGPSSLSLWEDIESLMAFSYSGVHAEALKNARNWNTRNDWPPLVLWWVEAGHRPNWAEGAAKLERLHDLGPGPEAFTFKQAFGRAGESHAIDRARVKALAESNRARQADLLAQLAHIPV